VLALALICAACNASSSSRSESESKQAEPGNNGEPREIVQPPFAVQGELDGLLLVWFDASGVHTAQKRSEVPEAQRAQVRIDSLSVAPGAGLDSESIYVADLRAPGQNGSYPVRKASRAWFDAEVDRAKPQVAVNDAAVVVYKASWCGVCRSAASYLKSRHVDFVEKDVEKEPGAQEEMLRKTQAKGLTPRGVPVIDFRGEIMLGFDRGRVEALIAQSGKAI
jgi:glutaredoxin